MSLIKKLLSTIVGEPKNVTPKAVKRPESVIRQSPTVSVKKVENATKTEESIKIKRTDEAEQANLPEEKPTDNADTVKSDDAPVSQQTAKKRTFFDHLILLDDLQDDDEVPEIDSENTADECKTCDPIQDGEQTEDDELIPLFDLPEADAQGQDVQPSQDAQDKHGDDEPSFPYPDSNSDEVSEDAYQQFKEACAARRQETAATESSMYELIDDSDGEIVDLSLFVDPVGGKGDLHFGVPSLLDFMVDGDAKSQPLTGREDDDSDDSDDSDDLDDAITKDEEFQKAIDEINELLKQLSDDPFEDHLFDVDDDDDDIFDDMFDEDDFMFGDDDDDDDDDDSFAGTTEEGKDSQDGIFAHLSPVGFEIDDTANTPEASEKQDTPEDLEAPTLTTDTTEGTLADLIPQIPKYGKLDLSLLSAHRKTQQKGTSSDEDTAEDTKVPTEEVPVAVPTESEDAEDADVPSEAETAEDADVPSETETTEDADVPSVAESVKDENVPATEKPAERMTFQIAKPQVPVKKTPSVKPVVKKNTDELTIEAYFKSAGFKIKTNCRNGVNCHVESLASFIADQYIQARPLIRLIRNSIVASNYKNINCSMTSLSRSERSVILSVAFKLEECGILSNVVPSTNDKTLLFNISKNSFCTQFINGEFLEIYAKQTVMNIVRSEAEALDMEFEYYSNVEITNSQGKHELDFVFRIGKEIFWGEVKSGRSAPADYYELGKIIGIPSKKFLFLTADKSETGIGCISHFYNCYCANIDTFEPTLKDMIRNAFKEEK